MANCVEKISIRARLPKILTKVKFLPKFKAKNHNDINKKWKPQNLNPLSNYIKNDFSQLTVLSGYAIKYINQI